MIEATAMLVVLGAAILIRLVVAGVMRKLAVEPADEAERSKGMRDVLRKLASHRRDRGD